MNLREYDAEPLLASTDWADNVLGLLAKGEPEKALSTLIPRIAAIAAFRHTRTEETVNIRLQEVGMINVMENKVLGPAILRRLEQERVEGRVEGRDEGKRELLHEQLTEKFGALPPGAATRLVNATDEDLVRWSKRILQAASLDETLR